MTERWIDYSGLRPDLAVVKANGATGVLRYLSEPIPATAWKRITAPERDAILGMGLDLILNYEWYEGRCLEGYAAGVHDGQVAHAQARDLNYPKGASIYFSHDTGKRDDAAVLAYLRGARSSLGGDYFVDIYGGFDVVEAALKAGMAQHGWQTLAWSGGRIGSAKIYQNGNQWFNGGADENIIRGVRPLGSWKDHATPVVVPAKPKPTPVPAPPVVAPAKGGGSNPKPVPTKGIYSVVAGDSLNGIAARYHTTVATLVQLNPRLKANPNLIQIGWQLVVPLSTPAKPVVTKPPVKPKPATPKTYRIAAGDTLGAIAKKHGTTVPQLMRWNSATIHNPNLIQVGWVIRVG